MQQCGRDSTPPVESVARARGLPGHVFGNFSGHLRSGHHCQEVRIIAVSAWMRRCEGAAPEGGVRAASEFGEMNGACSPYSFASNK